MQVELFRVGRVTSGPQFGVIKINGAFCCLALERPFLSNIPKVSSIPTGEYSCVRTENRTTDGGLVIPITYEVLLVPDRSGILFHVGNYLKDTHGCILPGLGVNYHDVEPMLLQSKVAFDRFIKMLSNVRKFDFVIKEF